MSDFRECPFCGCNTNARAVACCKDSGAIPIALFDKIAAKQERLRAELAHLAKRFVDEEMRAEAAERERDEARVYFEDMIRNYRTDLTTAQRERDEYLEKYQREYNRADTVLQANAELTRERDELRNLNAAANELCHVLVEAGEGSDAHIANLERALAEERERTGRLDAALRDLVYWAKRFETEPQGVGLDAVERRLAESRRRGELAAAEGEPGAIVAAVEIGPQLRFDSRGSIELDAEGDAAEGEEPGK